MECLVRNISIQDIGDYTIGSVSLLIVVYRIVFIMLPMASKSLNEKDYPNLFRSITLLV
tara:strand:- start:11367 stop:11543 length:177 start_codon:yes stop_codon:yes gene_type:complete